MRRFEFHDPILDHQQAHSERVDAQLGYRIDLIELGLRRLAHVMNPEGDIRSWGRMLHDDAQTWVGLNPKTLLTPYGELDRMCQLVPPTPNGQWVDLGAAYGRLAFVLNDHEPTTHFTGVECVRERVNEGNRLFETHGLTRARLVLQDLTRDDFQLPWADCYLIYDYGRLSHLRWTMAQLQNLAGLGRFHVIARGETIRSLIDYAHPWLFLRHQEHRFSVYANFV
jgi:hypothetical protein